MTTRSASRTYQLTTDMDAACASAASLAGYSAHALMLAE
jgi:hypothetical protein